MNKPENIFSPFGHKKNNKDKPPAAGKNPWLIVRDWYSSELGQALLANEKQALDKLLEQIFGYNLVQMGCLDQNNLTEASRTSHHFIFESLADERQSNACTQIISQFEQLAIQSHSIDAVILPHTLEFEANPHQILREVERILVPEGKAVFLGFNPFSLWGLWHKYWEVKKHISTNSRNNAEQFQLPLPSCGQLLSQRRLRDWLQLLGFDIELVSEYFYRPPVSNSVLLNKLEFMEQAGQFSKLLPAGGYLLVATRRVSTLTPIRPRWKFRKNMLAPEPVETAGVKNESLDPEYHAALNSTIESQQK